MLKFGHNSGVAEMGAVGCMECPTCHKTTPARGMVFYQFFHLWWLCSVVTNREYALVCADCNTTVPTTAEALEASGHAAKTAIPFLRRKGWMVFLALAVSVIVGIVVIVDGATRRSSERIDSVIANPQVGDLYLAEVTAVEGIGYQETLHQLDGAGYGALKLVGWDEDDGMRLYAISTKAWSHKSALKDFLNSSGNPFYLEGFMLYPTEEILALREKGIIYDAMRGEPLVLPDYDDDATEPEEGVQPAGDPPSG